MYFLTGLKIVQTEKKTKLEIQKLQLEKEKKLSELESKYKKSFKNLRIL